MNASGIIGYVKSRKTAKGLTTYSFTFDDREDERWFGMYTTEPSEVGTFVEFEYVTNSAGFHNVDNKTLVVTEKEEAKEAPAQEKAAPSKAASAYKGAGNKDANIQWQSARNAAVSLLDVANSAGALDLGTGKKGSKLDALLIQVNRLSVDFFEKSMEVARTGDVPEDLAG